MSFLIPPSQKNLHWMLGTQSLLQPEIRAYNIGHEPNIDFCYETEVKEAALFKAIIVRYYHSLTRREWRKHSFYVYDPLITTKKDKVSFFMRDRSNQSYWELILHEECFKDGIQQEGQIFVDFNNHFIEQIDKMKYKDKSFLRIDNTGFEYNDNNGAIHLPKENRPTLIALLNQINNDFQSQPDSHIEDLSTEFTWNQSLDFRSNEWKQDAFFQENFSALFDCGPAKGEIYNPFYVLRMTNTQYTKSRIGSYFSPKFSIKYWKETNEYLVELPLKNNLGIIRFLTIGRKSPKKNRDW